MTRQLRGITLAISFALALISFPGLATAEIRLPCQNFNYCLEGSYGQRGDLWYEFEYPKGLGTSGDHNGFFVADTVNHRIQDLNGGVWLGLYPFPNDPPLTAPTDVAESPNGKVFVADRDQIVRLSRRANGGFLQFDRSIGVGVVRNVTGIDVDSSGNVWVIDSGNDRVRKFTQDGRLVANWTLNGDRDRFTQLTSITVDDSDQVYVSQGVRNKMIQVMDTGDRVPQFRNFAGNANLRDLPFAGWVKDLDTDSRGNLFMTAQRPNMEGWYSGLIVKVGANGRVHETWGSEMVSPHGIAVTDDGRVYVSESEFFAGEGYRIVEYRYKLPRFRLRVRPINLGSGINLGSSKSGGGKSEKGKSEHDEPNGSEPQGKAGRAKSKAGKTWTVAFRK